MKDNKIIVKDIKINTHLYWDNKYKVIKTKEFDIKELMLPLYNKIKGLK